MHKKEVPKTCLLSNASMKKDCSKNSSLFYSHLRLVFVVNICNFIQRTSVPLNIILFGVGECVCVLCLALCFVRTQNAYSFTRSYCNANTDLSTQSDFANTPKRNPRTTHFPLISIHYSGFNCGDERKKTS